MRASDHLGLSSASKDGASMRDNELVKKVQQGQIGAFDELYYAYVDRVHRQLFAMLGPDSELEDMVQQTFVQVHRRIGDFRAEAQFATWLHRVAVNVALSHLRRRQRWFRWEKDPDSAPVFLPAAQAGPDETLAQEQKLRYLHGLLSKLKPKKRIAYALYEFEGRSLEEISALVDAPVSTVAARLRAAREELRSAMQRRLREEAERGVG